MKPVVIIGSSRKNGNTKQMVDEFNLLLDVDIINLSEFNIHQYDYEHKNKDDDFLKLMHNIINNYDMLIFATPVYWYSMSGKMKVFFDRITDLLDLEKELGRRLRNKNMAVLSSSVGDHLGDNFWIPFIETAKYLGINYIGGVHTIAEKNNTNSLTKFAELIHKLTPFTNK